MEVRFATDELVSELTLQLVGTIGSQTDPTRETPQSGPISDEQIPAFPIPPGEIFDDQGSDVPMPGDYIMPYALTPPPFVVQEGALACSWLESLGIQSGPMSDEPTPAFPISPSEVFDDQGSDLPMPGSYTLPYAPRSPPFVKQERVLTCSWSEPLGLEDIGECPVDGVHMSHTGTATHVQRFYGEGRPHNLSHQDTTPSLGVFDFMRRGLIGYLLKRPNVGKLELVLPSILIEIKCTHR